YEITADNDNQVLPPTTERWNWKKADWDAFSKTLKETAEATKEIWTQLYEQGGHEKAACPLQPQSKKKPHQIFRQAFFSLAENPSFPASPPLLQRKKPTTPRNNIFLSRERQEKVYLQSSDTSFRRNPVLSTPCR